MQTATPNDELSKNDFLFPASSSEKPIRAAIFIEIAETATAVKKLLDAGFTTAEITVVCSDDTKERYFREYEHQDQAGRNVPVAAGIGGAVGMTLFGLTAVAAGLVTGGAAFVVAGGTGMWTGTVVGGLVGAMMTRGFEREVANFYDQAVITGDILVAVEPHGANADENAKRLLTAESIFREAGAKPLPLAHG
jgi:hypothetical protein